MPKTEQEIRSLIGKNISEFRKKIGLTQSELAERINYSDKSVSKWERGEGLPDVYVLSQLAEICKVEAGDFFVEEPKKLKTTVKRISTKAQIVITALAIGLVLLFATVLYLVLSLVDVSSNILGLVYYCVIPVSAIVLVVFTAIWFKRVYSCLSVTLLIWSIAFGLWLYVPAKAMDLIFAVAAVLQLLVVLWYVLLLLRSRENKN